MYFLDLPTHIELLGMSWPTFGLLMAGFLSLAVVIVCMGGQITIMTTDCILGILSYPMYMAVVIAIILMFPWFDQMAPTLMDRPAGESMLDPYDIQPQPDYGEGIVITPQLVDERVAALDAKEPQIFNTIHDQMLVPVALRDLLPVGVTGIFCALMIFLMLSTDTTYMHS